jgi:phage baseplate assembly protein gpV
MAFLKSRAQRYFFDVYVEWDRLHFQFPRPQLAAHVLEWGRNLSSFSPRISAAGMAGLQVIRSYNQELAQTIAVTALAADFDIDNLVERLGSSAMDLLGSLARQGLLHQPVDSPLEAAELARSLLADLLEGMYEGTGSCIGMPELTAGRYITIAGVGRRFSGTYRVRKVTHRVDGNGYSTDFSITQRAHSSLMGLVRKQVTELPSPSRPERFYGVVIGVVRENNELRDLPPQVPLGRVKLSFPRLSDEVTSTWAPCVRPMAGNGMGFYALPEPGDQVLVAFEDGDLNKPYVLGGLWNAEQTPPATNADGTNSTCVIKSRTGHTITLDDAQAAGKLVIQDRAGSTITMNSRDGSMTVSANGNLTISAKGNVELAASGGATKIVMSATEVVVS